MPQTEKRSGKEKYQIIYSVILIIVIPVAVIINTLIFTGALKKHIDQVLYDKAIAIGRIINLNVWDVLDNPNSLQSALELVAQNNLDISDLNISQRLDDNFVIVASLDSSQIGEKLTSTEKVIAWYQGQPVAFLTTVKNKDNTAVRFWVVTSPLKDRDGQKQALLSMRMSLANMDQLTSQVLWRSYIILALTILVIVLLLANHTRFFEYATLYKRLKEVDQMKDEFISMASHELRTPVTGIKGYLSMILEGTFGEVSDEIKENLEIAQKETERLGNLVEDLLNVSRIEQGRLKVDLQTLVITDLIVDTIKGLKIQADAKKLTLDFKPHTPELPLIDIDPDRFTQVLINLLGNAIKYTMKGGVEVSTEAKNYGELLEIRIKDTGLGMSAQEREKLFEKFYRIKTEETKDIIGTGLGLWITKQLVELMKGKIAVDSIKGVGTQVTLNFPVVFKKEEKAKPPAPAK